MPIENPGGSPQDVGLHSFDVHLEDGHRTVDDVVQPPDREGLVDSLALLDLAFEADLVLPREVVGGHASAFPKPDLVHLHRVLEAVGPDIAPQHLDIAAYRLDRVHDGGRTQRREPHSGSAQVGTDVDIDARATQQTHMLEELLLVPAVVGDWSVDPRRYVEPVLVE